MTSFAKRLNARAWAAVRQSPAALAQHELRHRWDWLRMTGRIILALQLPIGLVVLPYSLTFIALGQLILQPFADRPLPAVAVPEISLAIHGLMLGLLLLVAAGSNGPGMFCERACWAKLAYAPWDEPQRHRHMRSSWIGGVLMVAYWNCYVFGFVGNAVGASFWQFLGLAALTLLSGWMFYGCAVILIWLLPRRDVQIWLAIIGIPLLVAAISVAWLIAASTALRGLSQSLIWALYCLPTAWVDGLASHGVLQANPWGLLWLLPIGGLSAVALYARSRVARVHEFVVSPQGALTPVFVGDPTALHSSLERPAQTAEQASTSPAMTRLSRLKRLVATHAFDSPDWSRRWAIERAIGLLLTPRERRIVEHERGGPPLWTLSWLVMLAISVGWGALVIVAPESSDAPLFGSHIACALGILFGEAIPFLFLRKNELLAARFHPLFPIGVDEALLTAMKVRLLRLTTWLPVVAAVALLECLRGGKPLLLVFGATFGIAAAALLTTPLVIASRFEMHGRPRLGWLRFSILGIVTILFFAGGVLWAVPWTVPLWTTVFWPISLAGTALVGLGTLITWRYFHWIYHRGELDYFVPNCLAGPGRQHGHS